MSETTIEERRTLDRLAEEIRGHHKAVERHIQAAVYEGIAAGILLLEAKGRLRHGEFGPWLIHCGINARSARVYMRLAANRQRAAVIGADSIRAALETLDNPSRGSAPRRPMDPRGRAGPRWPRSTWPSSLSAPPVRG